MLVHRIFRSGGPHRFRGGPWAGRALGFGQHRCDRIRRRQAQRLRRGDAGRQIGGFQRRGHGLDRGFLIQGPGQMLQVGGGPGGFLDGGEQGGDRVRKGLRQRRGQGLRFRRQGQVQGVPVQGRHLVQPGPAHLPEEQGEGAQAKRFGHGLPAQLQQGVGAVQQRRQLGQIRRQGQVHEVAALEHHHLVQGAQQFQQPLPVLEGQGAGQEQLWGVHGQADHVGVQLPLLEFRLQVHGREPAPDDALHLGLGHLQQIPLGDEAHLDEVLADAEPGLQVGQGVVHLGLGELAALHQEVGKPVLQVGALGEHRIAVVDVDGPSGILAQRPNPRRLLAVPPEKILEGKEAHGTTQR